MLRIIGTQEKRAFLDGISYKNHLELQEINNTVDEIIYDVGREKDEALRKYTLKFDEAVIDGFEVAKEEMENAINRVDTELKEALLLLKRKIEQYHKKQLRTTSMSYKGEDIIVGELIKPIDRVGIYASDPSSVLMNAIPARIAGVKEIIMITPPDKNGKIRDSVLAAAYIAGVGRIFRVGGPQGIAALAFGTESIPRVSKVVGSGNVYVSMAKKRVSGYIGTDRISEPATILILADEWANPGYIAADMMSQAENDEKASTILVTDSPSLGRRVEKEIEKQMENMERKGTVKKSLNCNGVIVITDSLYESLSICNEIAPEYLEILTKNPFDIYKQINAAGTIFLGEYSPVPLGNYFGGVNYTFSANRISGFSSAPGIDDFLIKTSLVYYSKEALRDAKDYIIKISGEEGLNAYSNSIDIRFREKQEWSI